jgi:hypothetical protein
MRLVWAVVTALISEHPGIQRLSVAPAEGLPPADGAICYPALSGRCAPGDRVLLNTTAVELGLGTGGWHLVVARDADDVTVPRPSGGHIMKLRYSPLQTDVASVEEGPGHDTMSSAEDLGGVPVVCCGLHSQLAPVAAAVKERMPDARVAWVMSDDASLALPLSDLARALRGAGLLDVTVSTGQSFGGEIEAVTLHSGMLAARHVARADVIVVATGPGVTGTDTPFGHGGVAQAEALNAAFALGGAPVAALRVSFADPRPRHRGVSHHTLGALGRLTLAPVRVAVPVLPPAEAAVVDAALESAGVWTRHERADADGALPDMRGVEVATMGRGPAADPAFFAAAAAAGRVAASR